MKIRLAKTEEAPLLTELATAAKQYWGYSDDAMQQWSDALRVTPSAIASNPTFVMADDKEIMGFYMLWTDGRIWELEHLWVAPRFMRRGIGRALLNHALHLANAGGGRILQIDADPNAEPFYAACGARRVSEVAAPIPELKDRVRPIMEIDLSKA